MNLVKIINDDIAIMNHDGITFMAATDCFENGNYTIGCYIDMSGLPKLIVRSSLYGAHIYNLLKELGYVRGKI